MKEMLAKLLEEQSKKREEVSVIPTAVLDLHTKYDKRIRQIIDATAWEIEEIREESDKEVEAIEDKYRAIADNEVKPLFDKAWEETFKSANLPTNAAENEEYSINRETGVLFKVVTNQERKH